MRKVLLLSSILAISACSTLGLKKPNCYESVAISKISLEQAYKSAADLSNEDLITVDQAKAVLYNLDMADQATDQASALCSLDLSAAETILDKAQALLGLASDIMGGKHE